MHNRHDTLGQTHLASKSAVVWHLRKYPDIDPLVDDCIDDRRPTSHLHDDANVGVQALEGRDQRHSRHRIAKTNAEFAACENLMLLENSQRLRFRGLDSGSDVVKLPAKRGRDETVASSVKQGQLEVQLERAHLLGHGWLGDAQPLGRGREIPGFVDGVQGADPRARQRHARLPYAPQIDVEVPARRPTQGDYSPDYKYFF